MLLNSRVGRPRPPWALLAIVVIAIVVRVVVIDRDALWLDEGYSWWDARQTIGSLWSLVAQCDPHPPLYFALLHAWIRIFGDGTIAMRAMSTLLGVATVVVVWLAGRELDVARGREHSVFGIASLSALLFALTPFQIYFSIEARPYALLCLGAALLTLASLRIVRSMETVDTTIAPSSISWFERVSQRGWLMLVAGAVIAVWTNNTAVLSLGAISVAFMLLWIFDRTSRASVIPAMVAGILVVVLWAPDWPLLWSQAREVTEEFWIPPPTFQGLEFELHNLIGLDVLRATWWVAIAMLGGLLLIGRYLGLRWIVMLGALAILPVLFNVAVSALMKPILISRAMIGIAPAVAIVLASAVVFVRSRGLRVALATGMIAAHLIAVGKFLAADHVKEPWKPVVARLALFAKESPILVVPNEIVLPLTHEARAGNVALRVRGVPADYPAVGMRARYPSGKCAPSVIGQDLGPLMSSLRSEQSVVLLTRRNNTYDPDEAIAAALRAAGFGLQLDEVFQPGDLRVMRFARNAS